ncbi:hypothetical protein FACS1894152_2550 [Bacilli bacterium]|nr:hypothetical protein FACS1894152_2550 [Bacilli bacterium]
MDGQKDKDKDKNKDKKEDKGRQQSSNNSELLKLFAPFLSSLPTNEGQTKNTDGTKTVNKAVSQSLHSSSTII